MADDKLRKRPLGQVLVGQLERDLIASPGQACMMFLNQVDLAAIPAEVEASPPVFRRQLQEFVESLGVGEPGWNERFLIHGIFAFPDLDPEKVAEMYRGIARKNRETAEALLRYFQARGAGGHDAEPDAGCHATPLTISGSQLGV